MSVENNVTTSEHECKLLNRHELSNLQQSELQRFIDQNTHLLQTVGSPSEPDKPTGYNQFAPARSKKGVKWIDCFSSTPIQRTRSLSPKRQHQTGTFGEMTHFGGSDYIDRNRQHLYQSVSPNYQNYAKNQMDYNRQYDRERLRIQNLDQQKLDRSRFSGYGDRPGSGVELMPSKWRGGEIVTDPGHLPRSLKPRRLYYSPIGDGVVAADGVELKHAPKDLSPRISVQHVRTIDRGESGQDGYNLYARTVTQDLAGSDYSSDLAGSGRESRLTGGFSPGSDSYGQSYPGTGMGYGAGREPEYKSGIGHRGTCTYTPPVGSAIPLGYGGKSGLPSDYDHPRGDSPNYAAVSQNAFGSTQSGRYNDDTTGRSQSADPYGDHGYGGTYGVRSDGRSSAGSHYSRKIDVDTDYMITNPRELIHQYATTTPVAVLDVPETTSRTVKKMYSSVTEETYVPYPPYKAKESSLHPRNFARQLRDEGLTASQKEANRYQAPLVTDDQQSKHKIHGIRMDTATKAPRVKDVDFLTEKMIQDLQSTRITSSNY